MAKMRDFNPKAVLVVRKASGVSLGGRRYLQGEAVEDDCISMRKRQQLYAQNYLCYPHELPEGALEDAKEREEAKNAPAVDEQPKDEKDESKSDEKSDDKSDEKSEDKPDEKKLQSDDDKSSKESSKEPSKPEPVKKRARKKKQS